MSKWLNIEMLDGSGENVSIAFDKNGNFEFKLDKPKTVTKITISDQPTPSPATDILCDALKIPRKPE
jgi:hypothetical protein